MEKINFCRFCLSRSDLIRFTKEMERIIKLFVQSVFQKDDVSQSRICINCSHILTCLDKFHDNQCAVDKITQEQINISLKDKNNFLDVSSETHDKLSTGFGSVINWLTEINVELKHISLTKEQDPEKPHAEIEDAICEVVPPVNEIKEEDSVVNDDFIEISSSDESEEPSINYEENSETQNEPQKMKRTITKPKKFDDNEDDDFNPDNHLDKNKKGVYCYKCPVCGQYYSRRYLIYHRNNHLGIKPYKCNDCQNEYHSPTALYTHMKAKHNYIGPIKGISYPHRKSVKENDNNFAKYRRNKQRRYKCSDCNFTHTGLKTLKYHLNIHKGIKPYKCIAPGCSKKYFSPYNASRHCKIIHKLNVDASEWTGIDCKSSTSKSSQNINKEGN